MGDRKSRSCYGEQNLLSPNRLTPAVIYIPYAVCKHYLSVSVLCQLLCVWMIFV